MNHVLLCTLPLRPTEIQSRLPTVASAHGQGPPAVALQSNQTARWLAYRHVTVAHWAKSQPDVRVLGLSSLLVALSRPRHLKLPGSCPACLVAYHRNQALSLGRAAASGA